MNYKNLLYFDIETCGHYKTLEDFKNNDLRGFLLFERKYNRNNIDTDWKLPIEEAYIKKSSLLPEYGKIICISAGIYRNDDIEIISYTGTEYDILKNFNNILIKANRNQMSLCGFNIKRFDIPWINKKFYQYDIKIPYVISAVNKKPWNFNCVDLIDIWRSNGYENSSLDEVAYALNIESPKQNISGEDVYEYYWDGKISEISKYCKLDVNTCYLIAKKILCEE